MVLPTIMKTTISEQSQLLERKDANLFGIKFSKHITETANPKKEPKVVYRDSKNDNK